MEGYAATVSPYFSSAPYNDLRDVHSVIHSVQEVIVRTVRAVEAKKGLEALAVLKGEEEVVGACGLGAGWAAGGSAGGGEDYGAGV